MTIFNADEVNVFVLDGHEEDGVDERRRNIDRERAGYYDDHIEEESEKQRSATRGK